MKRHLILLAFVCTICTISSFLLSYTSVFAAESPKSILSNVLSRNDAEGICNAIKQTLKEGMDAGSVVKTAIELGHGASVVIKCALSAGGSLERVIAGAIHAGVTSDVVSRCAFDAGAEAKEVNKYLLSAGLNTFYFEPEVYPYTPQEGLDLVPTVEPLRTPPPFVSPSRF